MLYIPTIVAVHPCLLAERVYPFLPDTRLALSDLNTLFLKHGERDDKKGVVLHYDLGFRRPGVSAAELLTQNLQRLQN